VARRVQRCAFIFAAALLAATWNESPLFAQGYGLYEQSTCMMGRAGAGVALPCDDGSSIFFNPAGIADERSPVISGSLTGIAPRGQFTNTTTNNVSTLLDKTYAAPAIYAAAPFGPVAVGVGLFAPYGLATDWPTTAEGRFSAYHSSVKSLYVQPTVALRLTDQFMIGGGIDITHTSVELFQRVDLSAQSIPGTPFKFAQLGVPRGTDFADARLTGNKNSIGGHIGVLLRPSKVFSVGARYLFRQTVTIDDGKLSATQIPTNLRVPPGTPIPAGTPIDALLAAQFAAGGALSAQNAATALPLPDQFVLGIAVSPTDRFKLLVDYQHTHWAMFDQLVVTSEFGAPLVRVENFGNTDGLRVGAEYTAGGLILRGGFDAHNPAAPDETVTPLLPEAQRFEVAGGAGLAFSRNFRLDLAYMFVHQADREGRSGDLPNNGTYQYHGNLFSAGIVVRF